MTGPSELDEILNYPAHLIKQNIKHYFTMIITDEITDVKQSTRIRRKIANL